MSAERLTPGPMTNGTTMTRVKIPARRQPRPFVPTSVNGPYRLPLALADQLALLLTPFRNREAAFKLAILLARFWSSPNRLALAFPIDRRALALKADLDLTESQIRGAIRTLETVGYLDRIPVVGRTHKPAADGSLHRKPSLFRFGTEALDAFTTANIRAARRRKHQTAPARRIIPRLSPVPVQLIQPVRSVSPIKTLPSKDFAFGRVQLIRPILPVLQPAQATLSELDKALARMQLARVRSRECDRPSVIERIHKLQSLT